jgi:type VI secretion system protein ImpF
VDLEHGKGAPAPLFDRLTDQEPHLEREPAPLRTLDRRGLSDSVRDELSRLLNSRCSTPADVWFARPLTVIDYGIPDFGTSYTPDKTGQGRVLEAMQRAIRAFEPRIRNVSLAVEEIDFAMRRVWVEGREIGWREDALLVRIEGELPIGDTVEQVSFEVVTGGAAPGTEIHGG